MAKRRELSEEPSLAMPLPKHEGAPPTSPSIQDRRPLESRLRDIAGNTGLLWALLMEHRATCSDRAAGQPCPTDLRVDEARYDVTDAADEIERLRMVEQAAREFHEQFIDESDDEYAVAFDNLTNALGLPAPTTDQCGVCGGRGQVYAEVDHGGGVRSGNLSTCACWPNARAGGQDDR